jgi:hypothetical protein
MTVSHTLNLGVPVAYLSPQNGHEALGKGRSFLFRNDIDLHSLIHNSHAQVHDFVPHQEAVLYIDMQLNLETIYEKVPCKSTIGLHKALVSQANSDSSFKVHPRDDTDRIKISESGLEGIEEDSLPLNSERRETSC